jgi:hypothetical protein
MSVELTALWGGGCGVGDTCPGEWAVRYPDGRRTRVRVGRIVSDPDVLAALPIGPGEVASEVDEADVP